jgi:hypothetical protein
MTEEEEFEFRARLEAEGQRPAPVAPRENTFGEEAKRQGLLAVRQLINAAASPAVLIDRAQAKAAAAMGVKPVGGTLGEDINARLTGLGIPEAERPIEKFTQGVAESAPAAAAPFTAGWQGLAGATMGATQAAPGEEGIQAAIGGTLGAALPGAIGAGKKIYNIAADATGPLRESWRTNQMRQALSKSLGSARSDVANYIAQNARPGVTTADLIAEKTMGVGDKSGASLVALENIAGKSPALAETLKTIRGEQQIGREAGISSFAKTPEAIEQAIAAREAVTSPMRDNAIMFANAAGNAPKYLQGALAKQGMFPLTPDDILKEVGKITRAKENLTNPTVQSAMGDIEALLANATNTRGIVPAEALYTLRKEAGNVIEKYASENKSWDKRFTSKLLIGIQRKIDDAIEKAGGNIGEWQRYLDVYKARSTGINQMRMGQELLDALRGPTGSERPTVFANKARALQAESGTNLAPGQQSRVDEVVRQLARDQERKALASNVDMGGVAGSSREGQFRMPHILSRAATITNAILEKAGQGADQKVLQDVGNLMMRDPAAFAAKYLVDVPPSQRAATMQAVAEQLRAAGQLNAPVVSSAIQE